MSEESKERWHLVDRIGGTPSAYRCGGAVHHGTPGDVVFIGEVVPATRLAELEQKVERVRDKAEQAVESDNPVAAVVGKMILATLTEDSREDAEEPEARKLTSIGFGGGEVIEVGLSLDEGRRLLQEALASQTLLELEGLDGEPVVVNPHQVKVLQNSGKLFAEDVSVSYLPAEDDS